jgi:hypothetical protein
MPPLRVSVCLISALSLFTLTIGALPAFAKVLISVDKSTQQMSVSVDGVPRYGFAVSTGRAGYGTPKCLPSSAFGGLVVFEAVLQFTDALFDLFPRGICNPWQL